MCITLTGHKTPTYLLPAAECQELSAFGTMNDIYKDIYSPVTFKCTQEFVLVTFHLYYALTNRTLQLAMYKSY